MAVFKFDKKKFCELVNQYSMDKYYLTHRTFQFNHLTQGQVALYRMGDSYEHIEEFSSHYASKVEPRGGPLNQRDDANVEVVESIEELKGKNAHFYHILDHFKNLLKTTYNGNLEEFIGTEFPKLSDGIGHFALHPLIHIGYGYSVGSATMVTEGLAFLNHTHFPITLESRSTEKLGKGNKNLLEVAELIQADDDLYNFVQKELSEPWLVQITTRPPMQKKMLAMAAKCGDQLLKYVHMLECPRDPEILKNWIVDNTIVLYQMAENRNDFFLLHGITASWSLANIIPVLKSTEEKLDIQQIFLCHLLSVYIGKDRPKLNPAYLESPDVSDLTWDAILARTVNMPLDTDEHEYKVVQICHEAALRNPEISDLCKRACSTVHDYEYHVRSGQESKKKSE